METIKIGRSAISGSVKVPPSKSVSHRALISAALSEGKSNIDNIIFSKDMEATISCLENLGAKFEKNKNGVTVDGVRDIKVVNNIFNCNESGSTIRFMIPIAMIDSESTSVVFNGKGKLVTRPLTPYINIFDDKNIKYKFNGSLPIEILGNVTSGIYKIPGNVSSQFVTGLLFSLSKLKEESVIEITSELESKNYVDITIDVMKKYGIEIINENYRKFSIKGNQQYKSIDYTVEGDFSQAAFFIVAGTINGDLEIKGLNPDSLQGDKEIINIVNKMGGKVYFDDEGETLFIKKSKTKGIDIDLSDIPDLAPILSVLGAFSEGTTKMYNGMRVRLKESDRLKAMYTELKKVGVDIKETEDGLIINGGKEVSSGRINSWNDHRIAMAMAVAALNSKEYIEIEDFTSINKSYPDFYEDLKKIGGSING